MGLLKRCFQVTASWQSLQETEFWDPAFFHRLSVGLFTAIPYATSFQGCCKMWICSLGFIYGPCNMALSYTFFLYYGSSWTTCSWKNWCNKVDQQHGQLISWGQLKSTICATEISDVQGLQQRIESGFEMNRSTPGIFRRVRQSLFLHATYRFKVQGGHRGHFLQSSGGRNLETMHQKAYIRNFSLHCGVETHSAILAVYFSFTLYITTMRICETGIVRWSYPGGGEVFRTRPDWPWGPPSLLNNGYRVFPGG
jgi:hypothetical protein